MATLLGPFRQLVTLAPPSLRGPLSDDRLGLVEDAYIRVDDAGCIEAVGAKEALRAASDAKGQPPEAAALPAGQAWVAIPGLVDCHTHLCFAGSRAADYALRIAGATYQQIAQAGGGIAHTVRATRAASDAELLGLTLRRISAMQRLGVTTVEVKSGYGLNVKEELRLLDILKAAEPHASIDLVPTFLGAHVPPKDYPGTAAAYLAELAENALPIVAEQNLARRVDIFLDAGAFSLAEARVYLAAAKRAGFDLTVHADQFTSAGSRVAVEFGAQSADHLEASTDEDIARLGASSVVSVVLPGASLGLGMPFAKARRLLDAGAILAIASDYNPGSAPMGDLLLQASVLAAGERLTTAETLSAITFRAAHALGLTDRGRLVPGQLADLAVFACDDYREILYHQGKLLPSYVYKRGRLVACANGTGPL